MFKVVIHRRVVAYLKRLPANQKERFKKALQELAQDPLKPGVKLMVGHWKGYYRLRIGDFRVIFWLGQEEKTIYEPSRFIAKRLRSSLSFC